jgi:hypothetical protein
VGQGRAARTDGTSINHAVLVRRRASPTNGELAAGAPRTVPLSEHAKFLRVSLRGGGLDIQGYLSIVEKQCSKMFINFLITLFPKVAIALSYSTPRIFYFGFKGYFLSDNIIFRG